MIILVREKNNFYSYSTIESVNDALTNNPMNPIIQTQMMDNDEDDKDDYFVGRIIFPSKAIDI